MLPQLCRAESSGSYMPVLGRYCCFQVACLVNTAMRRSTLSADIGLLVPDKTPRGVTSQLVPISLGRGVKRIEHRARVFSPGCCVGVSPGRHHGIYVTKSKPQHMCRKPPWKPPRHGTHLGAHLRTHSMGSTSQNPNHKMWTTEPTMGHAARSYTVS